MNLCDLDPLAAKAALSLIALSTSDFSALRTRRVDPQLTVSLLPGTAGSCFVCHFEAVCRLQEVMGAAVISQVTKVVCGAGDRVAMAAAWQLPSFERVQLPRSCRSRGGCSCLAAAAVAGVGAAAAVIAVY